MDIFLRLLIFFVSSFIVTGLVYYQIRIVHLQQIILVLLLIILVTLRLTKNAIGKRVVSNWVLLFCFTIFIQVLIASSGTVFSPFFVLIHLYVIGLSLFFSFWTAFSFLVLELVVLFLNIQLDRNLYYLVSQDFGSVLLYFSSILVITPVSKFISQQYHIKTATLKILFQQLSTQESIIEQIGDFVFITDKNLMVLSVNDSAKKIAKLSKENSIITDLIELIDEKGNRLTKETLLNFLSSIIENKPSLYTGNLNLVMKDYLLKVPDKKKSIKVVIRVNPALSSDGTLEKFIFLIGQTDEKTSTTSGSKLDEAHRKYISVHNILKSDPIISKLTSFSIYLEILKKYERDILIASEFNLYPAAPKVKVTDILRVFIRTMAQHKQFAQKLNINHKLNLAEQYQTDYRSITTSENLPDYLTEPSSLSVTTDPELLQLLIEKTLDVVTAIAYATRESLSAHDQNALVELEISPSETDIKLTVKTKINPEPKEVVKFLDINKGHLEIIDNLALSSGLESLIIKNILNLLSVSLTTEYNQYNHNLSFQISVNKYFSRPEH